MPQIEPALPNDYSSARWSRGVLVGQGLESVDWEISSARACVVLCLGFGAVLLLLTQSDHQALEPKKQRQLQVVHALVGL
jgi:hypothetical protein